MKLNPSQVRSIIAELLFMFTKRYDEPETEYNIDLIDYKIAGYSCTVDVTVSVGKGYLIVGVNLFTINEGDNDINIIDTLYNETEKTILFNVVSSGLRFYIDQFLKDQK
jgi:hypothetical protein